MTVFQAAQLNERPLRVLHCPWNIAGQSAQLAAAERALGADSRCIAIEETGKGFPADEALTSPNPSILQRERARWRLLWKAVRWADVVHFSFGQSCLCPNVFPSLDRTKWWNPVDIAWRLYCRTVWLKDLPLLKQLGKTLAVTWQGDDARQHDQSLALFDISIAKELGDGYYVQNSDAWKRRRIAAFDRCAPLHYAVNPDLLHVLPARARFMPYASFNPFGLTPLPPESSSSRPLVFAHAPSHRGAKGTEHVLAAAELLRSQGFAFELRLVEGKKRKEALADYSSCDIVIDQLLAGWYGGLGVEAMSLAKPVIAYLRESDFGFLDPALREALPVSTATPETVADVMRHFLMMPRSELHRLGLKSRAFVEDFHDPRTIAKRTLADYASVYKTCAR
jgi:hypothetical protein